MAEASAASLEHEMDVCINGPTRDLVGEAGGLAECGVLRGIPRKVTHARPEVGIETSLSQLGMEG